MAKKSRKIVSMIMIFVLTVVNYGMPLQVMASENGGLFSFNFFKKDEVELKAYFGDDEDEDTIMSNVNEVVDVTLEVSPLVEEYLKSGTITLNMNSGNSNNFKILSAKVLAESDEAVEEIENTIVEDKVTENLIENSIENTVTESSINSSIEDEIMLDAKITSNIEDTLGSIIEAYEVKLISDNEIELKNIIEPTKIELEVAYDSSAKFNKDDLYSEIEVLLEGKYIDEDLEEIEVSDSAYLTLGWEYSKKVKVEADFVKVSPFVVGDNKGTILEESVVVRRENGAKNSLPVKETFVRVQMPRINDALPVAISVTSSKLMATRGTGIEDTVFESKNWNYDYETGILEITVENKDLKLGDGEDEFDIICRYEEYVEDEKISLEKEVFVKVEEYSGKKNKTQEKEINEAIDVIVEAGELMSVTAVDIDELINKGTIIANNYVAAGYETEFSSIVKLTILTSDLLDDITLTTKNQVYKDTAGTEFDAVADVKYKGVKFNKSEIEDMLDKGSTLEILDVNGNVLETISKDNKVYEVNFENTLNDVKVKINGVQVNKNLSIEFVKVIGGSIYSPLEFSKIESLESKVDVEVKYMAFDEIFKISEITNVNMFQDTVTDVNFTMNRSKLSATQLNENVEFKLELKNDDETSDFYKNPTFDLVFPRYVKEVRVNSLNILYKNGLSIVDYQVLNENGQIKVRINLAGVQEGYNFSGITNGTNIVLNTDIVVDEMTPQIQDVIKVIYYNEAATDYKNETNWLMSKPMPEEVIKQNNGYEYIPFSYQTIAGFVTLNGISNFDEVGSSIQTIKNGKITAKLEMGAPSKIATMNLAAVNNTGNKVTDVQMLGRIPNIEATNVISNEKLGTNVDTVLVSDIIPDVLNSAKCDVYYSNKADANKNLNDTSNEWTKEPADMALVKSFLIIPTEEVEAGGILRFNYDFKVPENLPYDIEIYGNFGAYYNNHLSFVTMYETSEADIVGLETEAGPRLEATLDVDAGNGATVPGGSRLKYTITVKNTGSMIANNVKVTGLIPKDSRLVDKTDVVKYGDFGYVPVLGSQVSDKKFIKDVLNPGEEVKFEYYIKANFRSVLDEYAEGKDENGYYRIKNDEKVYITDTPEIILKNKAIVSSDMSAESIETNEVTNNVAHTIFDLTSSVDDYSNLYEGREVTFKLSANNVSGKNLNNTEAKLNVGKIFEYVSGKVTIDLKEIESEIIYDDEKGIITIPIGLLEKKDSVEIEIKVRARKTNVMSESFNCGFEIIADEMEKPQYGTTLYEVIEKSWIEVEDITSNLPETINENETVTISLRVKNISNVTFMDGILKCDIPNSLTVESINLSNSTNLSNVISDGKIKAVLPSINIGDSLDIDMTLKSQNRDGKDDIKAILQMIIETKNQGDVEGNIQEFTILNNLQTNAEILQDKKEEFEKAEEEYKEQNPTPEVPETPPSNTETPAVPSEPQTPEDTKPAEQEKEPEQVPEEEPEVEVEEPQYSVSGIVWYDGNKNGVRDNNEKGIEDIKVFLLDSKDKTLKETTTNSNGKYIFNELEKGKYSVAFKYDVDVYDITTYMKSGVAEDRNSDAISVEDNKLNAITNTVNLESGNISGMDLGLQNKDVFDLTVNKYISKINVTTNKGTKTYEYNNEEIAKVDIRSRELKGAKVDLEYTVIVANVGSLDGYAEKIKDNLPEDVEFDESKNKDWYKGTDGDVYVKDSNKVTLKPGEKKEYKLYLSKTMTEENTGVLSNKIEILNTYSNSKESEKKDNNISVQNTIITVSTGKTVQVVMIISICAVITIICIRYREQIAVKLNFDKVYKTKTKTKKFNIKKNFK